MIFILLNQYNWVVIIKEEFFLYLLFYWAGNLVW